MADVKDTRFTRVSATAFDLGESPVWDERNSRLVFVDIHVGEVHETTPEATRLLTRLPERVGAVGLTDAEDTLIVGLESGFALSSPRGIERLARIETDKSATRLNDGRVDRQGRFVCGGMEESDPQLPDTAVYRLDRDCSAHEILSGIHCANATCFSPDGSTMYFSDMATGEILAFEYGADGIPRSQRTLVERGRLPGTPDGSTVDAEGYIWNARWGAGLIVRIAPDGRVDREIEVPVTNPTSLTFGGDALDTLYITTARFGLSDEQLAAEPLAGHLLSMQCDVAGVPEPRFRL